VVQKGCGAHKTITGLALSSQLSASAFSIQHSAFNPAFAFSAQIVIYIVRGGSVPPWRA
jgi:hypothetical protein